MNSADENRDRAAEELESDAEERDEERSEADAEEQQDLDQGMQTGTRDTAYTGINWGSSYKTKPKGGKRKKQ